VLLFQDGGNQANASLALTGMLAANGVFVLCNTAIGTTCGSVDPALNNLSGNDVLQLVCTISGTDVILDVIGQIGNATNFAADQTLRRMCSVTIGDRDGTNPFNPATEWLSFPVNTQNGLGLRTCPCPGGNTTCP
jgi:hypothetical protein